MGKAHRSELSDSSDDDDDDVAAQFSQMLKTSNRKHLKLGKKQERMFRRVEALEEQVNRLGGTVEKKPSLESWISRIC